MEVLLVNRKQHKLLQSYLLKVNNLIKYMYETMLVMQPVMYIYTQEGMHVSQIQLTWKSHGVNTMAHGIFYVCHNTYIDEQIKCIKEMFDVMVKESERLADSPFYQPLQIQSTYITCKIITLPVFPKYDGTLFNMHV